jgi:hypothetical protein
MAIFKNPNSPIQPQAGVYGWFAEKDGIRHHAIYIGMAGKKNSVTPKGTLFRGVSELQQNTITSNSPNYDRLDTDFIVGTAIKFFELKGYTCCWEHLHDNPSRECEFVVTYRPVIQYENRPMIKEELRCRKQEIGYWNRRKSELGISEAETEIFKVLEVLLKL